jgi:hypothetical protein
VKIETGDFGALPPGLPARAHLRAYARAVGLDSDEVLSRLADRLPSVPDPLAALRHRARRRLADEHPVLAAIADASDEARRRIRTLAFMSWNLSWVAAPSWRHLSAAAIDSSILTSVGALSLVLSAWITGAGVRAVLRDAAWPLAISFGLTVIVYFAVSGGLARRTPGGVLATSLSNAILQRNGAAAAAWSQSTRYRRPT